MEKQQMCYLIDSVNKRIVTATYIDSHDIHQMVNGHLEVAYIWPNGDVCYVDEEGLLKNPQYFFRLMQRPDQVFAGNGVIVGKEVETDDGYYTETPGITSKELFESISFGVSI